MDLSTSTVCGYVWDTASDEYCRLVCRELKQPAHYAALLWDELTTAARLTIGAKIRDRLFKYQRRAHA